MKEFEIDNNKMLSQLKEANFIEEIKSFSEIEKLIDIGALTSGDDKVKIIKQELNGIILFDTPSANSNYLLELIYNFKFNFDNTVNYETIKNAINLKEYNISVLENFKYTLKNAIPTILNKIYYCQDEVIYQRLFEPYFKTHKELYSLETNKILLPVILTFIGTKNHQMLNDIFIDIETIAPLNIENIIRQLLFTHQISALSLTHL